MYVWNGQDSHEKMQILIIVCCSMANKFLKRLYSLRFKNLFAIEQTNSWNAFTACDVKYDKSLFSSTWNYSRLPVVEGSKSCRSKKKKKKMKYTT